MSLARPFYLRRVHLINSNVRTVLWCLLFLVCWCSCSWIFCLVSSSKLSLHTLLHFTLALYLLFIVTLFLHIVILNWRKLKSIDWLGLLCVKKASNVCKDVHCTIKTTNGQRCKNTHHNESLYTKLAVYCVV